MLSLKHHAMTAYMRVDIQVHAFFLLHWETGSITFCRGGLNILLHIYNVHLLWPIQTIQTQAYCKQQKQATVLCVCVCV